MASLVDLDNLATTLTSWLGKADGSTTGTGSIKTSGTITAASFNASSSKKVKENISDAEVDALKLIDGVKVVNFTYINDDEKTPHIGFIAEDTDTLLSTPHQNVMDYTNCIGVLLKAVQELHQEIKELKK